MGWGWGRLREAPWTLWAHFALSMIPFGLIENRAHLWILAVVLPYGLVINYFLLRGNLYVWWFLVVIALGGIPFGLINGNWPWELPIGLALLALLLAPPSRRYVFSTKESPPPEDGSRMRYWNPDLGAWQGRTRTPRKLRKAQAVSVPAGGAAAVRSSRARDLSEWDPAMHADEERPAGWYFAPGDLARMRYWDPEAGDWLGVARVPGRIRRRAERAAAE